MSQHITNNRKANNFALDPIVSIFFCSMLNEWTFDVFVTMHDIVVSFYVKNEKKFLKGIKFFMTTSEAL